MTYDEDGTILLGQIDDLEQEIGEIFRFLVPVMSPSAWLTANQEENAINGLTLTKGGFTKGNSLILLTNQGAGLRAGSDRELRDEST